LQRGNRRRLDGGVEREQVYLRGDGIDQADHLSDPACGFGQPFTVPSVWAAALTARLAMPAACWLMSLMEPSSSWDAEATLATLSEASLGAFCATSQP
jgi:hypothetical protein